MSLLHFCGDGLAQFGQAQVVGIKSFTALQRIDSGLADEVRAHLVAFAKPESQHIAAAQAGVSNITDTGGLQIENGLAHEV